MVEEVPYALREDRAVASGGHLRSPSLHPARPRGWGLASPSRLAL